MLAKIPIFKPDFTEAEEEAVIEVVRSGWIGQDRHVNEFEHRAAEFMKIDPERVVAVQSGTASLHLALLLAGIGPGDEVLVPAIGFIATANAVVYCGAKPVFVDVDPLHHYAEVKHFELALTTKTKAIIPVHVYGRMAPMDRIVDWAKSKGLLIIEDAAPAMGAYLNGKSAATWGDFGCISLHSAKSITTGEGGFLVTSSPDEGERARRLRSHGVNQWDFTKIDLSQLWEERFLEIGYNYRMTDIQAAIGKIQLRRYPAFERARKQIFSLYTEKFQLLSDLVYLPKESGTNQDEATNYLQYMLVLKNGNACARDAVIAGARDKGIYVMSGGFFLPGQKSWEKLGLSYDKKLFPGAIQCITNTLTLPVYTTMADTEVCEVAKCVCELVRNFVTIGSN